LVLIVFLFALTSALTGCGSSGDAATTTVPSADDESTQDPGGGSDNGISDSGSSDDGGSAGGTNLAVPKGVGEDFPFPILDGWVIDVNGDIGIVNTAAASLLYPVEDFDRLVDFYQQWTDGEAAEYAKTESQEFVVFSNLETGATITIKPNEEYGDQTLTLLGILSP
jgi:hypothetical protein